MWKRSGLYPDAAGSSELCKFGSAGRERRLWRGCGAREIPSIADLGEGGRWVVALDGEDVFERSPLMA